MDPALQNGPLPCRDPDAFRTTVKVRYPYMGTDVAETVVLTLLPAISSLADSFNLSDTGTVTYGMLGFDSGPEKAYMAKLRDMARDGMYFALGPTQARTQIKALAAKANEYLDLVKDYYTADSRSYGVSLSKRLKLGDETGWGPATTGTLVARNNLRLDIIRAYRNAAQFLWCANYGAAEIETYLENREEHETALSKPGPGGLVQPGNYKPVEYDQASWNIVPDQLGDLPQIDTEDPETEPQPEAESGGGGAVAIVAGVAALGLIYAFTRK